MSVDSYRTIQPGDLCWLIAKPHWLIFKDFHQTVTLNGNFFILEVWHEATEEGDESELTEFLSINTSLKILHSQLIDMAEKSSRKFIGDLATNNYWTPGSEDCLFAKHLSADKEDTARKLINSICLDTNKLKDEIATKAPIKNLIALTENLEKTSEDLNQLRYS